MRPIVVPTLCALAMLTSACEGVDDLSGLSDGADDLSGSVDEVTDQARFCFAITRALTGIDGGTTPEQALDAAEEVLAQAPDELRDDAELVAETLAEAVEADDQELLEDEAFQAAAERLRDGTRERCDPR